MESRMLSRILQWIFINSSAKRSLVLSSLIFFGNVFGIVFAGFRDESMLLPGDDRGVLEHPGAWAIVLGDLLIIPSVYSLIIAAMKMQRRFPLRNSVLARRYVGRCRAYLIDAILLNRNESRIYFLFVAFAVLFWINNAIQTTNPLYYYKHNIFDSIDYINGYIVMRVVLFVSWVVVMPYAMYVSLCICFSIYKIFRSLEKKNLIHFNPFHPDDCGGFSYFGSINTMLISSILVVYLELIVVLFTHRHLNPGLLSGFLLATATFLFFSFYMIIPVQRFLFNEKKRIGLRWYREQQRSNSIAPLLQLLYIKSQVSFSPYTAQQKVIIFMARSIPVVISVSKYLLHMS